MLAEEVHRLQGLLEQESNLRQQAESALTAAHAETSRLTHAREQLAGQVMVSHLPKLCVSVKFGCLHWFTSAVEIVRCMQDQREVWEMRWCRQGQSFEEFACFAGCLCMETFVCSILWS